jgi:hypothetical protein
MGIYCYMRRDEMNAGKAMGVELEGRKKRRREELGSKRIPIP